MKENYTRPIGEIFECHGVKLQVIENDHCLGCYFICGLSCMNNRSVTGYCSYEVRNDNKNVIFKPIDKKL